MYLYRSGLVCYGGGSGVNRLCVCGGMPDVSADTQDCAERAADLNKEEIEKSCFVIRTSNVFIRKRVKEQY